MPSNSQLEASSFAERTTATINGPFITMYEKEMKRVRCALWCVCCRKSRGEKEVKFVAITSKKGRKRERESNTNTMSSVFICTRHHKMHVFRLISGLFFVHYSYLSICKLRINFTQCRARPGVRNFESCFGHRSFAIAADLLFFPREPGQVSANMHDCV